MKEKLTVSDSKKLFYEQFSFVIPGLYKRIVDEMLVELNLLNHQNEFNQDPLFCIGLTETFKELTKGYKPEEHLILLFESLCNSSNFDASQIVEISKQDLEKYREKSIKEISNLLKDQKNSKLYSSRMLNLGIYFVIKTAHDFNKIKESEQNEIIYDVVNSLNLSVQKAEKDIGIYKSTIIKMQQARELIQESKIKDKEKRI